MTDKVKIVILAAGKGTRMKSADPKALAPLRGKHIIEHLLKSVLDSGIDPRPTIVVGYEREQIMQELGDKYEYVVQEEQLGTAHALLAAQSTLKYVEHIVVLYADQPFIKSETIKKITDKHLKSGAKITFATTIVPNFENSYKAFWNFARIIRDGGKLLRIQEFKDMTDEQKSIKEVNAGCYIFEAKWLWDNLKKIGNKNAEQEYYITDLLPIAYSNGVLVETVQIDPEEAMGANSKEELEILERLAV